MKKIVKLIIITAILFVTGIFIVGISLGIALSTSSNNIVTGSNGNKPTYIEYTVSPQEAEKIDIDLNTSRVNICPTEESEIKVSYWENKKKPVFEVKVEENTILIRNVNNGKWNSADFSVNMISLNDLTGKTADEHLINIYVPKEYAGSLFAEMKSGGLNMSDLDLQKEIDIRVNSGSVTLEKISCEETIKISSNSGGVRLSDIDTKENLTIDVISGGINGDYISANIIEASVNSGGIKLNHVDVFKEITTNSNSGGIHVGLIDSVEEYTITSHTNSGGNNLYDLNGNGDKKINATANSGGIYYSFDVK